MIKNTLVIGLIIVFSLVLLPKSAFAVSGKGNHSKPIKSEIIYDIPDSGDNAHPSGKDRSIEPGRSLTQGKSHSDPDNNGSGPEREHGKSDKPGSTGGVDKFDQDGNNGCGNDDDFEDDNEGWCGHKPKKVTPPCEDPGDKPKDGPKDEPKDGNGTTVTPPTITPTPKVLAATTKLPQTGNEAYWSLVGNLALAVSLILSGVLGNLLLKYRLTLVKK